MADIVLHVSLKETEDIAEEESEAQVLMVYKNCWSNKCQDEGNLWKDNKRFLFDEVARYVIERWPTRRD